MFYPHTALRRDSVQHTVEHVHVVKPGVPGANPNQDHVAPAATGCGPA